MGRLPSQSSALSDHVHALAQPGSVDTDAIVDEAVTYSKIAAGVKGGTPATIDPDDSSANGSASAFALADHQHPVTTGTPAALTLTGTSAESAGTGFARDAHVHATDALPWGIVAAQTLATNNGPHTTAATTDLTLADVVVDASRLYVVHCQCQISFDVAGGDWTFNFHVDGTLTLQLGRVEEGATGFQHDNHMAKLWRPSSGTYDLDVRLVENAGGASVTLNGSATVTRDFWVEDIGPR